MPRGIPNAKKDDSGMRYTSMHVPLAYVDTMTTFRVLTIVSDQTLSMWALLT